MSRSKKAAIGQDNQDQLPPAPPAPAVSPSQVDEVLKGVIQRRIEQGRKDKQLLAAPMPIPMPHYGELLEEFYFA